MADGAAASARKCCRFWPEALPLLAGSAAAFPLALLLCLGLLLPSCEKSTAYHSFRRVPEQNWAQADTLSFDIPVRDSLPAYLLSLEVRHAVQYPYRDLYLAVEWHFRTASGVSPRRHRVVRYLLADERGRWLGTGWGSLRVSGVPVGKLRFLRSGTLHCRVYHLMKTPRLQGIDDVGVRLSRL